MAADEEGFVVPPDGAMRAAGPVGRESNCLGCQEVRA
jgi:hypothetical protein